jgi:hypothetical protein
MAITTSFTVTPSWLLISFTSSRERDPKANRRCGVMRALKEVRGARPLGPGELREMPERLATEPPRLARRPRHGPDPSRQHLDLRGLGLGAPPAPGRLDLEGLGLEVEQVREDLRARHAVDGAVVDLRELRHQPVPKALDDVELPERAAPVERASDDARHLLGKLPIVSGRREPDVPDVEVEIEVRVLDPVRVIEPERDLDEAAAVRRQQVHPLGDQALDVVQRGRGPGGAGGIEEGEPADVSVGRPRLHVEEARVEPGELLHDGPSRAACYASGRLSCIGSASFPDPVIRSAPMLLHEEG